MPIFRALGLGLFLIILKLLTPQIFTEGERTATLFLKGAGNAAETATMLTASVQESRVIALPPYPLPQAPLPSHF